MPEQDIKINGGQQPPLGAGNGVNGAAQASGIASQAGKAEKQDQHNVEELPPELAHITANFQPISRLLERSAQECFNSLDETVTALANIPQHVNGEVTANGAGVVSGVNAQKRLRWLDFANTHRERFIKLLVLIRWSRHSDEISKIIDLYAWMKEQEFLLENADESLANLRRELDGEKVPSPDLETALEVLVTGESSKMPDLNYIQPDPLSATEVLQTLQNINTILHLRLNMHEDLPHHLRNFTIADGRVTFTIPHEFEMDLSIADEDPTSQFFFIDFRFLFSPSSEIPAGNVRAQFEARANEVLAAEGLTGCYDFFHDYVLTYKINILRRQAINLNRNSWAGSLSVEQVHRSLVIQYWGDKPGPKNWIEIGVAANRSKRPHASSIIPVPQPELRAKWIRAGKEVNGPSIELNKGDLDFTNILSDFVSAHCELILSYIQAGFPDAELIQDGSHGACLIFPLFQDQTAALVIEPTSRSFHISPVSAESQDCERRLNALEQPWNDGANVLNSIRPHLTLSAITSSSSAAGWRLLSHHTNSPFPQSRRMWLTNVQSCLYRPSNWEESSWAIGVTVDSTGAIEWNLCDLPAHALQSGNAIRSLQSTRLIALDVFDATSITDSISFEAANRAARSLIYLQSITSYCQQNGVHVKAFEPAPDLDGYTRNAMHDQVSIVTSSFLRDEHAAPYLSEDLTLSARQPADYVLKGFLRGSNVFLTKLSKLLETSTDVEVTASGAFALRAAGGIGAVADALRQFRKLLRWISRLPSYLDILDRRGFVCTALSMDSITFAYAPIPDGEEFKKAHCTIASGLSMKLPIISLANTPHDRLTSCFATMLAAASQGSNASTSSSSSEAGGAHARHVQVFSLITAALTFTLPLMLALDTLEKKVSQTVSLAVRPRTWDHVSLEYRDTAAERGNGDDTARKLEVKMISHAAQQQMGVVMTPRNGKIPADVIDVAGGVHMLKSGSVVCGCDDVAKVLDRIDEALRLPPPPLAPSPPKEEIAPAPTTQRKTAEYVVLDDDDD